MKRWQLPVYFQLRFREMVNPVEDLLSDPKASVNMETNPAQDVLALPGSRAVSNAIVQCWSDHVYLYGLAHRFWKLTLQLLKRYHLWVASILVDIDKSSNPEQVRGRKRETLGAP